MRKWWENHRAAMSSRTTGSDDRVRAYRNHIVYLMATLYKLELADDDFMEKLRTARVKDMYASYLVRSSLRNGKNSV